MSVKCPESLPAMKTKITQATINSALKDRSANPVIRDTEVAGLMLRVGVRSASWYLDYKPAGVGPDGRRMNSKSTKIGSVRSHSPDEARKAAAKLKVAISEGADPAAEKKARKAALEVERASATTLMAEAEHYIKTELKGCERHFRTESGALRLGLMEMDVNDLEPGALTVRHVRKLLKMHETKPLAVHRFGSLNRFCDYLLSREMIDENPCQRIAKRHRPKPPKPRDRVYSAKEVQSLLQAADELEGAFGRCLRAAIYLPLRIGEFYELRVENVDLDKQIIRLKDKQTKNGDPFAIPIPDGALKAFQTPPEARPTDRVFQLAANGKKFDARTKYRDRIRAHSGVDDFNFHPLRDTLVTTLAERDIGNEVVADALLNHRQSATRGGIIGVYNHARQWTQKLAVMTAWGEMVDHVHSTGAWPAADRTDNIVPLIRGAG